MEKQPANPNQLAAEQKSRDLLLYLANKASKVQDKYDYYDADNDIRDFGISVPRKMVNNRPGIGWASRAVNTLGDRVVFEGFAGDSFSINDYLESTQGIGVINQAKHDAFVAGCAFVAVSDDPDPESNKKLLIPFTALEATGVVDQKTGLLKYGLAVTEWSKETKKINQYAQRTLFAPADYMLFMPDFTAIFKNKALYDIVENPTGRCLLHHLSHRSSVNRPLGKSRITNTVRRIIQEVGRQKRREEIAEEFYSNPQRYINGLAEGAKKDDKLDSALGKAWTITKDEDGDKPDIGQLAQMNIDQFETAKKDKARDFCAETALTLRNLGYETGNPAGPESLKAMSDDLLLEAQTSQTDMGEQIKEIAITLRLALDGNNNIPDGLKTLKPAWKPIFQVDIGAAGDAMFKLFEVMPELQGTVTGYRLLGIGIREAEELAEKRKQLSGSKFMNQGGQ